MIAIHKISDSDETLRELLDFAKELRLSKGCTQAYLKARRRVGTRILKKQQVKQKEKSYG